MNAQRYTLPTALLASLGMNAQPVLDQLGNAPIGSHFSYSAITDSIDPGPPGVAQVWDFSTLPSTTPVLQVELLDPAETSHGAQFPTADRAERMGSGTYFYYNTGSDRTDVVGFVDSLNDLVVSYPDPWQVAQRPFAFGGQVTDALTRAYDSFGLNFGGTGACTVEADGHGTLILPTGQVNNVLRVRLEQNCIDTSVAGNIQVHLVRTSWYIAGSPFAVMTIEYETVTSDLFSNVRHLTYYADAMSLSVNEAGNDHGWSLLPGESAGSAVLSAPQDGIYLARWFNVCGVMLANERVSVSGGRARIIVPSTAGTLLLLDMVDAAAGTHHVIKVGVR